MDNRQQRPQRKMLQWQVTQEPGQQSFPDGPSATSVQPDTESNPWKDLQTQDWVCEPPGPRRLGSCWNVSIEERRRLAMQRAREGPGAGVPSQDPVRRGPGFHARPAPLPPRPAPPPQDITRMVAELASEDVVRDVLLPHRLRSFNSSNAFQDFLTRSAPFWQNANFEALT
uniref:Testis expressed gene 22 n=1 Tax=Nannospalax galili TaxID=1026970 RepID=A0A8C6RAI8_NANGA